MCRMSVLVYGSLNIMINSGHNIIIKLKGWFLYKWWSFESVNPVYSLCFSLAKGVHDIERRSNNFTKTKFVMGLVGTCIQKEQDEKCSLAKNQPVSANWWWDISNVVLQWLHKNTSKKACIVNVTIQANFIGIRMVSSEQTGAYSITTHQFALACVAVSAVVRKWGEREIRHRDRPRGRRVPFLSPSRALARPNSPFPFPF